jgi:hypothetical protein
MQSLRSFPIIPRFREVIQPAATHAEERKPVLRFRSPVQILKLRIPRIPRPLQRRKVASRAHDPRRQRRRSGMIPKPIPPFPPQREQKPSRPRDNHRQQHEPEKRLHGSSPDVILTPIRTSVRIVQLVARTEDVDPSCWQPRVFAFWVVLLQYHLPDLN